MKAYSHHPHWTKLTWHNSLWRHVHTTTWNLSTDMWHARLCQYIWDKLLCHTCQCPPNLWTQWLCAIGPDQACVPKFKKGHWQDSYYRRDTPLCLLNLVSLACTTSHYMTTLNQQLTQQGEFFTPSKTDYNKHLNGMSSWVLQKVDQPMDWVSNLAVVEKKDGSLR